MILDAEPALVIASPLVLETVEAAADGVPDRHRSRRARARRAAADRRARRRRPRRARLHGRNDRPREGRDADAREPLGSGPARPRGRPRGRHRPFALVPAALALVRAARAERQPAPSRPAAVGADALVQRRGVARARAGAPQPDRAGRPVDALHAAPRAARGLRPVRAALRRLRRGAARAGGDPGVRPPRAGLRDPRGLRPDGDVGARLDEPARPHPATARSAFPFPAPRFASSTARSACAPSS